MLLGLRRLVGLSRQGAVWTPTSARLLAGQIVHRRRNEHAGFTDDDHLRAVAQWLERAQDATTDGGVSGRFSLARGWTSSYPETTGYIIPTFLALAEATRDDRFVTRAARCVDFLERVQLEDGAFPGGEVDENRTRPSVFNSAQILHGLVQFHRATGEERALIMARRAADWLAAQQDDDGAFRRHAYHDIPVAYAAHASCWIAEAGEYARETRWLESGRRHLDWVLAQRDPATGWFDHMGFDGRDSSNRLAVTHTIAYTLWGVLHSSVILGRDDGIAAVRQAASAIARRLELSRRLPGTLDSAWRGRASFTCLTGNAQMALVWMRLHALDQDFALVNAAFKAIDTVKAAQPMWHGNPGIRGGIPGSDPVWGDYIRFALPNWSAKFFIDALLAKREVLARVGARTPDRWTVPGDVPVAIPAPVYASGQSVRVVLYARDSSAKVAQMVEAWSSWGFRPAGVVIETPPTPPATRRVLARVREDGLRPLARRIPLLRAMAADRSRESLPSLGQATFGDAGPSAVEVFCRARGIPVTRVGPLDTPAAVAAVAALRPDLAIHAGAGILRAPLLGIPRLGTLNAHMGVLPRYRGVNVAEWARLGGGPVGCTVHLVDVGIDTGKILCVREISSDSATSIAQLRAAVDDEQIRLLGQVVRWVVEAGTLPPRRAQTEEEGRQFFRMHPDLAAVLERELAGGDSRAHAGVSVPPAPMARGAAPVAV